MSKKGKGKKAIDTPGNQNNEVIVYIGLAAWNTKCDCLKKIHGKRLALRVNKKEPPATLLEKALTKRKAYKLDCFCEDEEYLILLEDFQEAVLFPGTSCKEFFTLERYRQELGKDVKRITLYICTKSDYHLHECRGHLEHKEPDKGRRFDVDDFENVVFTDDSDFEQPGTSGHSSEKHSHVKDHEEPNSGQIRSDHNIALALHKSINNEDDGEEDLCATVPTPHDAGSEPAVSDLASVVQFLQNNLIDDCHLFLAMRRGTSLNWVVQVWQRERKKKPVEYKISIKNLGEEGMDTGAWSTEFLANMISNIAKIMFPNGRPVHSTLFI